VEEVEFFSLSLIKTNSGTFITESYGFPLNVTLLIHPVQNYVERFCFSVSGFVQV